LGFKVELSIEKDFWAHQTLTLRAFFRQFPPGRVPGKYYDVLRGAAERDSLFARFAH
jgi:DNA (cytosine-5)-methyltransferase 1